MDEKVRQLLESIPERPPRSKLEPHAEVIRELRRKRRTYQEIATFFREHLHVSVAPSTLHEFVKTRARKGRPRAPELRELSGTRPLEFPAEQPLAAAPNPAPLPVRSVLPEPLRAVREPSAAAPKEQSGFQFDAEEQAQWKPKSGEK